MYPVIFRLGPLTVHSYGVMLAIAFFIGFFLFIRRAKTESIATATVVNLSFIILISGLIGARILFILIDLEYYLSHPSEIIMLHRGGLAYFGGLALASLSGFAYLRKVSLNPWKTIDLIIPYIVLGESIVRVGCFLNGCCYGTPTDLPWAVSFPPLSAAYAHFGYAPLHPAQLYQAVANFAIFLLLLRSSKRYDGEIFLMYLLLYSLSRFFIEFLRGDSIPLFLGLGMGQITAILIFIASAVISIKKANK